jgi:hypothetical protein
MRGSAEPMPRPALLGPLLVVLSGLLYTAGYVTARR